MSSHEDRKSFVIPQSTSLQPESHRKKKKNVLSGPPSVLPFTRLLRNYYLHCLLKINLENLTKFICYYVN